MLILKGADVNSEDTNGMTPLHMASQKGHHDVAEFLIENGAKVNNKDHFGSTPLFRASMWGHLKVVELLLSKGADVNAKDTDDASPLTMASKGGHTEVVKLLLTNGATIDEKTIFFANKEMKRILDKWPQTMAILALQENHVYNLPDMSYLEDLDQYMGTKDGRGKSKRFRKSNKNKKKTIQKRRRFKKDNNK
jgi:ankyrin repeat protein